MEIDIQKYKDAFVHNLRVLMNGKSVAQFSKENGLSRNAVNNWMLKKVLPRKNHLIFLAQKFDCSIDYLLGLEE